jgi:hypothetical protein
VRRAITARVTFGAVPDPAERENCHCGIDAYPCTYENLRYTPHTIAAGNIVELVLHEESHVPGVPLSNRSTSPFGTVLLISFQPFSPL